MTLCSKPNPEPYFFKSFLEKALNGEEAYIEIVKPILLEASDYKNKKITLYEINREYFKWKLYLQRFKLIGALSEFNLCLKELLEFIEEDWVEFYNTTAEFGNRIGYD